MNTKLHLIRCLVKVKNSRKKENVPLPIFLCFVGNQNLCFFFGIKQDILDQCGKENTMKKMLLKIMKRKGEEENSSEFEESQFLK